MLVSCSTDPKTVDTPARRRAADALRIAASNSFAAGGSSAAVADLTAQLALYAGDYNAYHDRGRAKYWLHDFAGAVADYDKAILLKPQCGGFYCNRGQSRFALNDMPGALADYNKAIELNPSMAVAYLQQGQLTCCADKDFCGAIADFTKAIELRTDPQEGDIFFARANAEMESKTLLAPLPIMPRLSELNPSDGAARTNLAAAQKALQPSRGQ